MFGLARKPDLPAAAAPVLDLSGPRLRRVFENLAESAEATGGIERYVGALALKASLFDELLGKGDLSALTQDEFCDLIAFVSPVRRRIGAWLAENDFSRMRRYLEALFDHIDDVAGADAHLAAFVDCFPADREHRWTRDLGAELLHFTRPDLYPLMTRWVWDRRVGSGVLREIWHADDVDTARIDVDDGIVTHLTLRQELEGFLADNGVFRDLPFYVDLLCAHVYSGYINDRGGQYLRADFCGDWGDGMLHTRRMLGLDAVDTETGRTRLKLVDGKAWVLSGLGRLAN